MPPADVRPKLLLVLMANLSWPGRWITRPGHWSTIMGIVRYASATLRMEAWEPGGRFVMRKATMLKVPQVHGKLLILIEELID